MKKEIQRRVAEAIAELQAPAKKARLELGKDAGNNIGSDDETQVSTTTPHSARSSMSCDTESLAGLDGLSTASENQSSRGSTGLNAYRNALPYAPQHVKARLAEIAAMAGRGSGKQALKSEIITEFLKNRSWNNPFFEKMRENIHSEANKSQESCLSWAATL